MAGRESSSRASNEEAASEIDVLRSGRDEARVVLDHQLETLSELHAKAVRTVRFTGIIFGLVLSAATLPGAGRFVNPFTLAGTGGLALTILSGLVAYSASDPKVGIEPQYLSDIRTHEPDEREWFDALVRGYKEWILEMEELNHGNARMLTVTQTSLGASVLLFVVGILVEEFGRAQTLLPF